MEPLPSAPIHKLQRKALVRRAASPQEGDELRALVQSFVRSFGFLATNRTPCGKPLSVSHAHALMILLECSRVPVRPTQRQLGTELGIDKSNVARLCARMENAGHIIQQRCEQDGRARRVSLTDKGARVAANVEASSRARFTSVLSAIAPHARAGVLSALEALNDAVRELAPREDAAEKDSR